MGLNLFVGKSQAWLEEQLNEAQDALAAGGNITGGGVGEVSFTQDARLRVEHRVINLLKALSILDPEKYPPSQNSLPNKTVAVLMR